MASADNEQGILMQEFEGSAQPKDDLLQAILPPDGKTRLLAERSNPYLDWFWEALQIRSTAIAEGWLQALPSELQARAESEVSRQHGDFPFHLLASAIADRDYIPFIDLDHAVPNDFLPLALYDEGHLAKRLQLLFCMVGALTYLYDPIALFDKDVFAIRSHYSGGITESHPRRATWKTFQLRIAEQGPFSVGDILSRLGGGRFPISQVRLRASGPGRDEPSRLMSMNLCYFTLSRLVGIKIRWVNTICEHLDFDQQSRTVSIFRFPSFCALMASSTANKTFLDSLFHYHVQEDQPRFRSERGEMSPARFGDLCREVICSLRILFGQNKQSWKSFRQDFDPRGIRKWIFSIRAKLTTTSTAPTASQGCFADDPLLSALCGENWADLGVYEDVNAPHVKSVYAADVDFPYFGEKLGVLQEFVATQEPTNWTALWSDRRDIHRYYALWLVLWFGVVTISLSVLAVVFGLVQMADSITTQ